MSELEMSVGPFRVETTSDAGHPPEFYAERICDRLMYVAETAPPPIKAQAQAYRRVMRATVLAGIRGAIQSSHTTIIGQLRRAGMSEAAALIDSLRR